MCLLRKYCAQTMVYARQQSAHLFQQGHGFSERGAPLSQHLDLSCITVSTPANWLASWLAACSHSK